MIIAIDGTSSSGKSSISKELGKKLNIPVLGTGLIYRAVAKKLFGLTSIKGNDKALNEILALTTITTQYEGDKCQIIMDGLEEPDFILHSPDISKFTPVIAVNPIIREFVRKIQHQEAKIHKNIIVEGRDIGSVVFPNADFKFFIDADIKTRAERRLNDYINQGRNDQTLEMVINEIEHRDEQDRNREISPLIMTSDAHIIDSSNTSIIKCVNQMIEIINRNN